MVQDNRNIVGKQVGYPLQSVDGAPTFMIAAVIAAATSSYTLVADAQFKFRVIDVKVILTAAGGAADTLTVKNGSTAITDDLDLNKSDATETRAATYDDAQWDISPGGSLKVSTASGPAGVLFVTCMKVN